MSQDPYLTHHSLELQIADKYRQQGFDVIIEPHFKDVPFDLRPYRPDLVVTKAGGEKYIIEVKNSSKRLSVGRYQEIAEIVSEHSGWRFLLITGDDVVKTSERATAALPTWKQLLQRKLYAEQLIGLGQLEGAFLLLWVVLESSLRKQSEEVSFPIEKFQTNSIIKHLYSMGELSMGQFDQATVLSQARNTLIHGFEVHNLDETVAQLKRLVDELLDLWSSKQQS